MFLKPALLLTLISRLQALCWVAAASICADAFSAHCRPLLQLWNKYALLQGVSSLLVLKCCCFLTIEASARMSWPQRGHSWPYIPQASHLFLTVLLTLQHTSLWLPYFLVCCLSLLPSNVNCPQVDVVCLSCLYPTNRHISGAWQKKK